jgi:hypothetical protein
MQHYRFLSTLGNIDDGLTLKLTFLSTLGNIDDGLTLKLTFLSTLGNIDDGLTSLFSPLVNTTYLVEK